MPAANSDSDDQIKEQPPPSTKSKNSGADVTLPPLTFFDEPIVAASKLDDPPLEDQSKAEIEEHKEPEAQEEDAVAMSVE